MGNLFSPVPKKKRKKIIWDPDLTGPVRAPVGHAVVCGEDEGGPPVRPPVAIAQVGHQAGAAVDGEEVAAVRLGVGPGN